MPKPDKQIFDPEWYLAAYPDVAKAGIDPWQHYTQYGQAEGRLSHATTGEAFERDLWTGFADRARPVLEAQATGPDGPDKDMARWWLGRWHFAQGDMERAATLSASLVDPKRRQGSRLVAGWVVVAIGAALQLGDTDGARKILSDARKTKLNPVELDLMSANIEKTPLLALNRIWQRAGAGLAELPDGELSALDRITARPRLRYRLIRRSAPLVSVILPAFNAESTLPAALAGLLGQSWRPLEVVVVDDGSTDATGAVAEGIARTDSRIRILTNTVNEGAYAARNRGLAAAKGEYVTVQDADDWAHPEKIQRQVQALVSNPDLAGSLSHWVRCSPELAFTRWRVEPEGLVHRNVSSLLLRRSVIERLGFWDRVRVSADTEYYYRVIAAFGGQSLTEILPGVPLSLGRVDVGALTSQPETHVSSQIGGLRADYLAAAARWHVRAAGARREDDSHPLFLPKQPERRPFAVPQGIGLGDPEASFQPDDVIRRSPVFDTVWYAACNEDVRHAGVDPAIHYLQNGAALGRDPSPRFSTSGYRITYLQDDCETNPVLHWQESGKNSGLDPMPCLTGSHTRRHTNLLVFGHQAGRHLFGAERSLLDMLDRMIAAGHGPMVVLPHILNKDYLRALLARCTAIKFIPYFWRHSGRRAHKDTCAAIQALISDVQPDEVHINTLVLDTPAVVARAAGVPVVVHVRERPDRDDAICEALGMNAETIRSCLLAETDRFVANSTGVADWIDAPDRTTIVPNRIDPALFDLPLRTGAPPRVAMISSNIAKKGVADFIAMARYLEEMRTEARCLLIGPESAALAALRPLPAIVEAPGYVRDAREAIDAADIVVNLSHFAESFGRTVLEAMAAGRPVVCYARGHLQNLVEHGKSGFLVPPDDPKAAAKAVLRLIADDELRRRMGLQARRNAEAILREELRV